MELLLIKLLMSYYPETDTHIKNKVKVVLNLTNYATNKKLGHASDVAMSDLAAKKLLIAMKAKVDKLAIHKLVNVTTSFNNLKIKVEDLDVGMGILFSRAVTLTDYTKFTKDILNRKIKKERLVKKSGSNEKIKTLATKAESKGEQDKTEKL